MGIFIPGKQRGIRKFDYEPRYYNPEKDEKIKRRIRIQSRVRRRRSPIGLIYFGVLLLFAIYIYMKMG